MSGEFDRQLETLLEQGYPALAGLSPEAFRRALAPLRALAPEGAAPAPEEGRVPFVIVIQRALVTAEQAMPRTRRGEKRGIHVFTAGELERFMPIEGVLLPGGVAYLALEIDTGREFLNLTPDEALRGITGQGRSPLTIEEGVSLLTQYPAVLQKNACFSLPGSRSGDRRVAALWISEGRPKLGWCWAGNPHTWLGSASCAQRRGAP